MPITVSAATSTWTGGGFNNNWSPQANWGTTTLPTTTGTYSLVFSGTTRVNAVNNIGNVSISSLSFTNNGGTGQNAFFSISGSSGCAILFNNASIVTTTATTGIFTSNSNGDTISSEMKLSGTSVFMTADLHNLSLTGNMSGSGAVRYVENSPNTTNYKYIGGNNTYSGSTVIEGGYVQTGPRTPTNGSNNSAFGSGSVTISERGTLLIRNNSVVTNGITVSGTGQTGSAVQGSFGTAGSTAEVQGPTTLAGSVQFATASSAAADITSKLLLSGPIALGTNTLTLRSGVRSGETNGLLIQATGAVSGSGGVVVDGAVDGSRVLMSGNNSYSGGTTIRTGTLAIGSSTALGNGSLTINPSSTGVLDLNGQALQVGALSGNGAAIIQSAVAGAASVATTSTSNTTYAGIIRNGSGVVGFTKAGSGEFTLTGNNTYSGNTTVAGGSLIVNGSLANTVLSVQTGGQLGGSGTIGSGGAVVTLQSGSTLASGNSSGRLAIAGNLTLCLGSTYAHELVGGTSDAGSVDVDGELTLGDTTLSLSNLGTYVENQKFTLFAYQSLIGTFDGLVDGTTFTAGGGEWRINYHDTSGGLNPAAVGASYVTLTAVPEPTSPLIGVLVGGSLITRRRRAFSQAK